MEEEGEKAGRRGSKILINIGTCVGSTYNADR